MDFVRNFLATTMLIDTVKNGVIGLIDSIIIMLSGKKVAVLGPRNSGKSTLLNFLSTGELSTDYIQTLFNTKIESNCLRLTDLKLHLSKTVDVSGSVDAIEDWKKLYSSADIGLYLVNAAEIDRDRIARDLGKLESWSTERPKGAKLIVVVTHLDQIPGYMGLPASEKGNFRDQFVKQNLDSGLAKLKVRPHIVLGSLHNKQAISDITYQIISLVIQ